MPTAPSSSIMDSLFQRTLDDLIKGLRLHSPSPSSLSSFLSTSLSEIRRELTSTDPATKSTALLKLTYLHSLHHSTAAAATAPFAAVELTSSPRFLIKKIAYLSAAVLLHPSVEVLLLLPNQLRKDLSSPNSSEASLALEFISIIASPDLSRDLTPEIFTLLSSNKLFIRKKAIAAVLTVFRVYPDAVRVCLKRLVENLDSSDLGTVSVTVSVFCELAMSDPRAYLPLAPEFYRILVDSRNNWVLIKVLKIFAKLAPLEPRLGKKVVDPVCDHLRRTVAKSLAFECIRTVLTGLVDYERAVNLAIEKIRDFLSDDDSNLKYLGLHALTMLGPMHFSAVVQYKNVVFESLSVKDPNVKIEALRLVMKMVSEDNVAEICKVLVHYALKSDPEFCNEILGSILSTCSGNYYELIVDFDWYVSLLGELSRIPHCQKGGEIENQLIDIGIRVRDVRPELVRIGRDLVIDPALLGNPFLHRILSAAAWVSGEYVEFSKNPIELIEALLQPRTDLLPPSVRAVYIQSALKVLMFCLHSYFFPNEVDDYEPKVETDSDLVTPNEDFNPRSPCNVQKDGEIVSAPVKNVQFSKTIVYVLDIVKTALCPLLGSHEVEMQERARNVFGLIDLVEGEFRDDVNDIEEEKNLVAEESRTTTEIIRAMRGAFSEELGLVSMTAQERVPIPDGLVLVENLNELEAICADLDFTTSSSFSLVKPHYEEKASSSFASNENEDQSEPASESTSLLTQHRKRHGLYYLPSDKKETKSYDYPPANEPKPTNNSSSGDVDTLVMLTEKSLVVKKKSNQMKPRPVVVRLDEGGEVRVSTKQPENSRDDSISGAVRDVLVGNEAVLISKQTKSSDKSMSSKSRDKDKSVEEVRGFSRKSKHRGKERKHRGSGNNVEEREEKSGKDKKSKNKARQRADGATNVVVQNPVIPDFLL